LREKDHFTAAVTVSKMRQALEPLMLGQHTFDEGVERIRVGMWSGMSMTDHASSRSADAPCSKNAEG
jgi:hypothetical protein